MLSAVSHCQGVPDRQVLEEVHALIEDPRCCPEYQWSDDLAEKFVDICGSPGGVDVLRLQEFHAPEELSPSLLSSVTSFGVSIVPDDGALSWAIFVDLRQCQQHPVSQRVLGVFAVLLDASGVCFLSLRPVHASFDLVEHSGVPS